MYRKHNGSRRLVAATLISLALAAPVIGNAAMGDATAKATAMAAASRAAATTAVGGAAPALAHTDDTPWDP